MAFDGFEDGTMDLWTISGTSIGTLAASTNAKKNGNYGARFTSGNQGGNKYKRARRDDANDATGNYYAWFRLSDTRQGVQYAGADADSDSVFYWRIFGGNITYSNYYAWVPMVTALTADTWYRLRATRTGTNTVDYRLYDTNNDLLEDAIGIEVAGGSGNVGNMTFAFFQAVEAVQANFTVDFDDCCYNDTSEPTPPITGQYMAMNKYW